MLEEEVFGNNVSRVLNIGTNNQNNLVCISQAARYEGMYVAVGIHPEDIRNTENIECEVDILENIIGCKENRKLKKIAALGEIGLDYHYEGFDKEKQMKCFELQLQLANRLDIPVVIHDREAHGDCFEIVLKYPDVTGVFHSYSGSAEMAQELVRRGWYISFSGVATFKNAPRVKAAVERVPLDRILVETDAPYLAPHPFRGQINHSGLMKYTVAAIADIKGTSFDEMADITYDNASRLFNID